MHNSMNFILHQNNWGVNNKIIALVGEYFSNPWYLEAYFDYDYWPATHDPQGIRVASVF